MNNRQMAKSLQMKELKEFKDIESVICIQQGREYTLIWPDNHRYMKMRLGRILHTFNKSHKDKFMAIKFKGDPAYGMLYHGSSFVGKISHKKGDNVAVISYPPIKDGSDSHWVHAINLVYGNTCNAICGSDAKYTEEDVRIQVVEKGMNKELR